MQAGRAAGPGEASRVCRVGRGLEPRPGSSVSLSLLPAPPGGHRPGREETRGSQAACRPEPLTLSLCSFHDLYCCPLPRGAHSRGRPRDVPHTSFPMSIPLPRPCPRGATGRSSVCPAPASLLISRTLRGSHTHRLQCTLASVGWLMCDWAPCQRAAAAVRRRAPGLRGRRRDPDAIPGSPPGSHLPFQAAPLSLHRR